MISIKNSSKFYFEQSSNTLNLGVAHPASPSKAAPFSHALNAPLAAAVGGTGVYGRGAVHPASNVIRVPLCYFYAYSQKLPTGRHLTNTKESWLVRLWNI